MGRNPMTDYSKLSPRYAAVEAGLGTYYEEDGEWKFRMFTEAELHAKKLEREAKERAGRMAAALLGALFGDPDPFEGLSEEEIGIVTTEGPGILNDIDNQYSEFLGEDDEDPEGGPT